MKTLLCGFAALLLCCLASCSKDKAYGDFSGSLTIGVISSGIRSAGIFRDSLHGGIGLVFCSGDTRLDGAVSELPEGSVLCLDVPERMMDGLLRALPEEAGSGEWAFCYCAYSDSKGTWLDGLGDFHALEDVVLGTFRGWFGADGSVHVEFYAYSGEGFAVGCSFDGFPEVSGEYIWKWDQ